MKLYVGCSLTHASEEFRQQVEGIKNILRGEHEVADFVGLTAGSARDVYEWDIHKCVEGCDAFIAICDFPSIGLGYELGVAVEKLHVPTLALAYEDVKVTRMVLGIEQPHYHFARYRSFEELPAMIEAFLSGIQEKK